MESRQALAVEPVRGGGAGASISAAAEVKAVAHPVRAQILIAVFWASMITGIVVNQVTPVG